MDIIEINNRLTRLIDHDRKLLNESNQRLKEASHSFYVKRQEELKIKKRELIKPILNNLKQNQK